MKLFIGLGNPGEKYKNNRHNVGFMVVDKMAGERDWEKSKKGRLLYCWISKDRRIELVKPMNYMNNSGLSAAYVQKKHPELKPKNLYVIHDDLDLQLGKFKIQKGKGPREHKGLQSVYESIGNKDFWHVRVGVDNRSPENRTPGEQYVLQDFTFDELERLKPVIDQICKKLATS